MDIKYLRQFLKALGDDTRLRLIFLLGEKELMVKELQSILTVSQPIISKHLSRLRLLKIVTDRRKGNRIYYSLNTKMDEDYHKTILFFLERFSSLERFRMDRELLEQLGSNREAEAGQANTALH